MRAQMVPVMAQHQSPQESEQYHCALLSIRLGEESQTGSGAELDANTTFPRVMLPLSRAVKIPSVSC